MATVPVPAVKLRVRARVDDGASFEDFLAARKKQNTGGPGRFASPVLRHVTRVQAEEARSR